MLTGNGLDTNFTISLYMVGNTDNTNKLKFT